MKLEGVKDIRIEDGRLVLRTVLNEIREVVVALALTSGLSLLDLLGLFALLKN